KQAQQSVLASFAGPRTIVITASGSLGQRILHAATDVFLGWTEEPLDGRCFYVRRLKDHRLAELGSRLAAALPFYARLCGRTLACAHARAGDAVALSTYLDKGNEFDKAIAQFAAAYADQTRRDWRCLLGAIEEGRICAGAVIT